MATQETFELGDIPDYYTAKTSRHRGLNIVYYDGVGFMEFPEEAPLITNTGETIYRVRSGEEGRLDIIAARAYGTTKLWWFIAQANDIFNPFTEMYAGMPLRIPPIERLGT